MPAAYAQRLLLLIALCALLAPSARADHAIALGYTPKYPAGFDHFAYVNPKAPKGGTFTIGLMGSFDTLNPYLLRGDAADGAGLMFETLMAPAWDEPFGEYGLLADDVKAASDGLSVTYHLNPKARFSNGDPVTAADVQYSFIQLTSDGASPQYKFYYRDVARVVVVDPATVRFEFQRKNSELALIVGQMPVFSHAWGHGKPLAKLNLEPPIGSGPYLLDQYHLGADISFRRNPHYWGADLPSRRGHFNFDRILYRYYKDETVLLEGFKAGEYDVNLEASSKQWARNYNGPKFRDGSIQKAMLPDASPQGMQGYAFNMRRPLFQDIRVRQALGLAFDFEWSNRMLFFQQYVRSESYFNNSEMAAKGAAQGEELALLEPFRNELPAQVFQAPPPAPDTAPPRSLRDNLRQARALLAAAGWVYRDGALRNSKGEPMVIEAMLQSKPWERITAPYARNLQKLGIALSYRTPDPSLYEKRIKEFDFDLAVIQFPISISPGNELFDYFSSAAAKQESARNYSGIQNPVVDALLRKEVTAKDRHQLIIACRALDRVLLAGYYVVPHWYINVHRFAWWNRFQRPATLPLYYDATGWALETWWQAPAPH